MTEYKVGDKVVQTANKIEGTVIAITAKRVRVQRTYRYADGRPINDLVAPNGLQKLGEN